MVFWANTVFFGKYSGILGKYSGILGKYRGIFGKYSGILGKYIGILGKYSGILGKYSGLYIDSIAALIVVKQLWPQKELVPERLGDPGGSGPRSSTSQEKGAGLAVQYFLSMAADSGYHDSWFGTCCLQDRKYWSARPAPFSWEVDDLGPEPPGSSNLSGTSSFCGQSCLTSINAAIESIFTQELSGTFRIWASGMLPPKPRHILGSLAFSEEKKIVK